MLYNSHVLTVGDSDEQREAELVPPGAGRRAAVQAVARAARGAVAVALETMGGGQMTSAYVARAQDT